MAKAILPMEDETASQIRHQHSAAIEAMTALLEVYVDMVGRGEWTITITEDNGTLSRFAVQTVGGLAMKAAKTFRSIQVLLERGFGDDAAALIRVLFETLIAVKFILQTDSTTRTSMYHAHASYQMVKTMEHWKRLSPANEALDEGLSQSRQTFEHWVSKIPAGRKGKATSHWSGFSLEAASKAVGLELMYASLYRYTSGPSHAADFAGHVTAKVEEDELLFHLAPSTDDVPMMSAISREVLWLLGKALDDTLQLGFGSRLAPHRVTEMTGAIRG